MIVIFVVLKFLNCSFFNWLLFIVYVKFVLNWLILNWCGFCLIFLLGVKLIWIVLCLMLGWLIKYFIFFIIFIIFVLLLVFSRDVLFVIISVWFIILFNLGKILGFKICWDLLSLIGCLL